jgi:hypothetical protein
MLSSTLSSVPKLRNSSRPVFCLPYTTLPAPSSSRPCNSARCTSQQFNLLAQRVTYNRLLSLWSTIYLQPRCIELYHLLNETRANKRVLERSTIYLQQRNTIQSCVFDCFQKKKVVFDKSIPSDRMLD